MKPFKLFVTIAAAALLAACGGGHDRGADAPPAAVTELPASAGASVQAFQTALAGLGGLAGQEDTERALPLSLDQVLPPTSDTAEPLALN